MFRTKEKLTAILVAIVTFAATLLLGFATLLGMPQKVSTAKAEIVYTLVTDASTLAAGDKIIIAATGYDYALSTTQKDNNRGQAAITKSDSTVTFGNDVQIITLEEGKTSGTFAFNVGKGYLYAASSSKNYLRTETTLSANSSWKITIKNATTGEATIKAQGSNTRNWLQYNQSSSIFSTYSSAQQAICLYKLIESSSSEPECEHKFVYTPNDGQETHAVTCSACTRACRKTRR